MRHYLHNGKGYRALPYTKLKLMLCAFQPYINLNFFFTYITFSQSGSHIHSATCESFGSMKSLIEEFNS